MFAEIFNIFIDIVTPVYLIVLLGYLTGPKLELDARTLSRVAYYIFVPSFIFSTISKADIQIDSALQMIFYITVVHLVMALIGFIVAKLLGHSKEMVAAYVMIAIFGNVGNFGLSLVVFRFGQVAVVPGAVYFLTIMLLSFTVCVSVASSTKGGGIHMALSVLKTPAVIGVVPAIFFLSTDIEVPLFIDRMTGLLGNAMIPMMLFALGVQLTVTRKLNITFDVITASSIRLIGGPIVAALLIIPFGLVGIERGVGILQASMPAAVLVSIIAIEYEVVPDFVTKSVLFSTLISLLTLTVVIYLV